MCINCNNYYACSVYLYYRCIINYDICTHPSIKKNTVQSVYPHWMIYWISVPLGINCGKLHIYIYN